ncbi:hypothetical protein Y032_0768g2194 [Ancylostoma ceylanicum]|uniref:Uncharacterized protein n=1 Tax=Ancylostoma ceylanicum TaxID=53326 RepID=A0A016WDP1_9BILA|nr:hypothetical protein Y032_0768g2194 [Ancylostoma ceylanicum]
MCIVEADWISDISDTRWISSSTSTSTPFIFGTRLRSYFDSSSEFSGEIGQPRRRFFRLTKNAEWLLRRIITSLRDHRSRH